MANKKKKVHFVTNKATGKRTGFMPQPANEGQAIAQVQQAISFCLEEFRAKHGESRVPEIVVQMKAGRIEVLAKNY